MPIPTDIYFICKKALSIFFVDSNSQRFCISKAKEVVEEIQKFVEVIKEDVWMFQDQPRLINYPYAPTQLSCSPDPRTNSKLSAANNEHIKSKKSMNRIKLKVVVRILQPQFYSYHHKYVQQYDFLLNL